MTTEKIRFLCDDTAIVTISGHSYEKGRPEEQLVPAIITAIVSKIDGTWLIVSYHNAEVLGGS